MGRRPALRPNEWLDLIAERAPELRRAGVESVTLDKISITLARLEPTRDYEPPREDDGYSSDPLYDRATYAGGKVPGYVLERDDEADEEGSS